MTGLLIDIELPANRAAAGVLRLYEGPRPGRQRVIFEARCLGKADNEAARGRGNASRDPGLPWGDVPTGTYPPAVVVWFDRARRIGEAWIPLVLDGARGDQVERALANKRYGLGIHAGRGTGRLVPTFGCVRLEFRDFVALVAAIGNREVAVTIRSAGE